MRDTPPWASRKGTEPWYYSRESRTAKERRNSCVQGEGWQGVQKERGCWRGMRFQTVLRGFWKLESPLHRKVPGGFGKGQSEKGGRESVPRWLPTSCQPARSAQTQAGWKGVRR